MMPEMDGFTLCQIVKDDALTSHIPVVLLTAKASDDAKIEGLAIGADAYLIKPFNAKELHVRVKSLIAGRRKLREKYRKERLVEPAEIDTDSLEDTFLKKAHALVELQMANPAFNAESMLCEFAMSQRQFYRKMQALTGQTPGQFIRTMRLKKAQQLLKNNHGSVSQISFQVGFSNLSYFAKCFREQFGKLPSDI
jgi:DNA-binding response OmpR family regulator